MTPSPLRLFDWSSVEYMVNEGVRMMYDPWLEKIVGEWDSEHHKVRISRNLPPEEEDITIVHEWLHAFEDLVLNIDDFFRDSQIEWWARFHYRTNPELVQYIRSFYQRNGF